MVKTVTICTRGECNGECYACRLKSTAAARDKFARLYLRLYDAGIVSGAFGPWSDLWTDEDRAMWDEIDRLKEHYGIAPAIAKATKGAERADDGDEVCSSL